MRQWKQADSIALRKLIEGLLPSAIQEVLGHPTIHRVLSSNITYSALEPEGATFTINIAVQVNEKKQEPITEKP